MWAKIRRKNELAKENLDFLHKNMSNKCQMRQSTLLKSNSQPFIAQ